MFTKLLLFNYAISAFEGSWGIADKIASLKLAERDSFHLSRLPDVHKDPFDRMLICQAIENGLTLLTSDRYIQQYPVKTLW